MNRIWILVLLAACVVSCNKHSDPKPDPAKSSSFSDTVIVDQSPQGPPVSPIFEGMSFETSLLVQDPAYLNANNKVLIQLVKNLGQGILRIGGDSSDQLHWTGKARTANTGADSLTTTEIDRLAAFSGAIGWPVIWGLNGVDNNNSAAVDEAVYVSNSLGSNLYDLQIGNEPDIYAQTSLRPTGYTVSNYIAEWTAQSSAIKALLPQATFAGPDAADKVPWIRGFAMSMGTKVNMIDAHYYADGPASDTTINYRTLLAPNFELPSYLQILYFAALQSDLGYRITESNSVYGGGKKGVSETFASALWALDLMWMTAANKGQGINFHGGNGLVYSPVSSINGIWTANPEYYAMLAFKYAAQGGAVLPAALTTLKYNCTAYACLKTEHSYTVTVINKELDKDIDFTVQLGKTTTGIDIARLTAPSVTSTSQVSLSGSSVSANGTFIPGPAEHRDINDKTFVVKVPAASAAIITVY